MTSEANAVSPARKLALQVRDLSKGYRRTRFGWHDSTEVVAARNVSFEIGAGETLALVGRSGRASPPSRDA